MHCATPLTSRTEPRPSDAGGKPPSIPPGGAQAPSEPGPTVRHLAVQYMRERRALRASGNLTRDVFAREKRILKRFARGSRGRKAADAIRPGQVRIWLLAQTSWRSDYALRDAARIIRSLFTWAVDEGYLERNPIRAMRPCWSPPQPRQPLDPVEYETLMRTARNSRTLHSRTRFRFAVWFLWNTGCRTCELRQAKWSDVDWRLGLIVLQNHKTARTTGKPRLIPLSGRALRVLAWLKRKARPGQANIFVARSGQPLNKDSFGRLFRRFARLAGLRRGAVPYALRHSWCVSAIELNLSDRKVANAMGHSGTQWLGWYGSAASKNAEILRETADAIDVGRRAIQAHRELQPTCRPHSHGPYLPHGTGQ